jgi:hypothetical protein
MIDSKDADLAAYTAAVRARLADLPAAELDALAAHLAEVAAESDQPLAERLGPPEVYAAELRAAFGARPEAAWWSAVPRNLRFNRRVMVVVAGVAALGVVAIVAIGMFASHSTGPEWPVSTLVANARAGQVRSIDIRGNSAVARAKDGSTHSVHLPDNTEQLSTEMVRDGVDVTYENTSAVVYWLVVLLPNLILAGMAAAFVVVIVFIGRRRAT